MHVTVSSCTNYTSRYICRQRSRFPINGSLFLIVQFKERNAALEWAAVSWGGALRDDPNNGCEGDYVTRCKKKIVQVKETLFIFKLLDIWLNISHEIHIFSRWPKRFRLLSPLCLRQIKRSANRTTRVNKYGKKTYMSNYLNCWGTTSNDKKQTKKHENLTHPAHKTVTTFTRNALFF